MMEMMNGFLGDRVLVNGQPQPTTEVEHGAGAPRRDRSRTSDIHTASLPYPRARRHGDDAELPRDVPGTPVQRLERAHLQAGLEPRCRNGRDRWYPREYFYGQLRSFTDAGFGKRIVFGSDQMMWPGVIEPAIAIIEEAPS